MVEARRDTYPLLLIRHFVKTPTRRQRIGGFFSVGDGAPSAVVQPSVSQLMCDDVTAKRFRATLQPRLQHHAATRPRRAGMGQHHRPAFAGSEIIERNDEAGIRKEVLPIIFWNRLKNALNSTRKDRMISKRMLEIVNRALIQLKTDL